MGETRQFSGEGQLYINGQSTLTKIENIEKKTLSIESSLKSIEKLIQKKELTKNSLKYIQNEQLTLLIQVYVFGIIGFIGLGFLFFKLNEIFKANSDKIQLFISLVFTTIVTLIFLRYLYKLNKTRMVLSQKYIAFSTLSEIREILSDDTKALNYEYRASIKSTLDSVNDLIKNDTTE